MKNAHTVGYSLVAVQEMNLAYYFPIVYWNTANLIVDSSGVEYEEELDDNEEEEESEAEIKNLTVKDILEGTGDEDDSDDDEDEEENYEEAVKKPIKKPASKIKYGKISTAIGRFQNRGIQVLPPDINTSGFTFTPDANKNVIFYGLRGITRISVQLAREIIESRPYEDIPDFLTKNKVNKLQMLSLIKSGAFDGLYPDNTREEILLAYMDGLIKKAKQITMATVPTLMGYDLIPYDYKHEVDTYYFNAALKKHLKGTDYILNSSMLEFYCERYDMDILNDESHLPANKWKKEYEKNIAPLKLFFVNNKQQLLAAINEKRAKEALDKDASGNISHWEMESLSFYYHEHELSHIDKLRYGIVDFDTLPEEPPIKSEFVTKDGKEIKLYELSCIAGTVLDRDKLKRTVTLLTTAGVVQMKVWNSQFQKYNKRISEVDESGSKTVKKVREESWFTRGNLLMVQGIRRGKFFVPKAYKNSTYRVPIMKIEEVHDKTITYVTQRYDEL